MPPSTTSISSLSTTTTKTTAPPKILLPLPHPSTTTTTTTNTTSTTPYPPLPTALRSTINAHLLTTPAISTIHSLLQHNLQRAGWTDNVRHLVLDLLRSGECVTFGECMASVIRAARGEEGGKGTEEEEDDDDDGGRERRGVDGVNGGGAGKAGKDCGRAGKRRVDFDVRIPEGVVDEGVRVVREELEEIVEVVEPLDA